MVPTLAFTALATLFLVASCHASSATGAGPRATEPTYRLVFLVTGKDASAYSEERIAAMQEQHVANLMALGEQGRNKLAGPVQDARPLRGIVVMDVDGEPELEDAFAPDPYIAEGLMVVHSHPWRMTAGELGTPRQPFTLGEYAIGLVHPADGAARSGLDASATRLASYLAELDSSPLAAGGPIAAGESTTPCGMLLFRTPDLAALERILASAPEVRSGSLRVELHPFLTGRGSLDG